MIKNVLTKFLFRYSDFCTVAFIMYIYSFPVYGLPTVTCIMYIYSFPVYGLPTAVDVLMTGTYSRIPLCIKDKIIPSLTLTDKEKSDTLSKLTSLIEQRLVLSKIPIKYKTIEIGSFTCFFEVRSSWIILKFHLHLLILYFLWKLLYFEAGFVSRL